MLARNGLGSRCRVTAGEEMPLSVPCTRMIGLLREEAGRKVQREKVIKQESLFGTKIQ